MLDGLHCVTLALWVAWLRSSEVQDPSMMKVKFQVVTATGSKDLDQRVELTLPLSTTVGELKRLIEVRGSRHGPYSLTRNTITAWPHPS